MARGCHRLLREGAALIEAPEELLGELGFTRRRRDLRAAPTDPNRST